MNTVARTSATRVAYATSARYIGTRESRATAPALGPLNCEKLVKPIVSGERAPAATVYRTGGSGLLLRQPHSPGHSLSTECPSRRVCHCFPCRFLDRLFPRSPRNGGARRCKGSIVRHDRTDWNR